MSRVRVPEGVPEWSQARPGEERPVGQEVKTGASHAPNVGSIPARVTTLTGKKKMTGRPVNDIVGADNGEGPPVPIPNTVVKLTCADITWLATARERR